jgi:invasion protein IalB
MSTTLRQKSRLLAMAAAAAGMLVGGATVSNAQEVPRGWFKACSEQQDVNVCNVQNIMVADSGQLLTGVSLIQISGNVDRRVFQVTVPTGRMVPPGIGMQIDGGQTRKLDYVICLPDRCIAEAPLNDEFVATLKRGGQLTLTSVNFQNQQNPINISLSGFTAAFDGPALQASDIEARQRQLQDFVSKNTEDFARKLREEQERAKAGQ